MSNPRIPAHAFTIHYTLKHGGWLNQAEIEIGLFARQCLGQRRFPNLAALKADACAWNLQINRKRTLIAWKFSRFDARNVFHYQENLFIRSEKYSKLSLGPIRLALRRTDLG